MIVKPFIWLPGKSDGSYENYVYLINDSNEVLDLVKPYSTAFLTADDDVSTKESTQEVEYRDVKPGESVLVDVYHSMYDSDFMLSVTLLIESPSLGQLELSTPLHVGGIPDQVLVWDTLEIAKNVRVKKQNKE